MYHTVKVGERTISPIDWEMTPDLSFGTYESWGGRERVRDNSEQVYYFFIDDWGDVPKVCLMERAVKHARVLAEIDVPLHIVEKCVKSQGDVARFEKSHAVNEEIKSWLIANVLDGQGAEFIRPVLEKTVLEDMGEPLAKHGSVTWDFGRVILPSKQAVHRDDEIEEILRKWNFYDSKLNPGGIFANGLVDPGDGLTVIDERTGLQWQKGGLDICSIRMMHKKIAAIKEQGMAGFRDWRLPSLEEAMSLMDPVQNFKGVHLNPCFSTAQPFVFVAASRKPGGYWFVDYKQGRIFWSSGTIPGGFARLCRSHD